MNSPSLKDKIPPYNEEAEEAAIGALLLNFSGDILDLVLSYVHPDDFYKPANGNILRAVMNLFDRGAVPDILSVKEELKTMELLDKSGGAGYLAHLTSSVPHHGQRRVLRPNRQGLRRSPQSPERGQSDDRQCSFRFG